MSNQGPRSSSSQSSNSAQPAIEPSVESFLSDLENGRIQKRPVQDADLFHLTEQSIEIIDRDHVIRYDLNSKQVEIPYVAFTGMKIKYDREGRRLVFEAFRGADKNGENGIVVARQTLSNIDIMTSAQDAELFQFLDSKSRLHVIDLGLVATQLFRAPIPVFQNIWEPSETKALEPGTPGLKSGFLTRGSTPFELGQAVLTPHDANNEIRLSAGDFYVSYEGASGGKTQAYAIFSRDTTYEAMTRGYKILQWQAALLSTDTTVQAQVENLTNQIQTEIDKSELELINEKISPQARIVVSALNKASVAELKKRETSVNALKANSFDRFSPSEWQQTYDEILKNVGETPSSSNVEETWFKLLNKVNADAVDREKKAGTMEAPPKSKLAAIRSVVGNSKFLITVGTVLTAAAAGLPYAYDHFEAIQQIKVISWAYEAFYPTVLKDATYRTPLLLSMASLAALWPEAIAFSAMTGKVLASMAEKVKNETSRRAIYIKDLARNWAPLTNWQRITSFGMRLYAWMILPYWRVLIDHIAQQKTFFTAVNNDLNPFERLAKDSELGKKLGLSKNEFIGLNQVFGAQKAAKIELNKQMQSAKVQENQKLDSIALLVAATLVAEKYKMDPALLLVLGQENGPQPLEVNRIAKILDTPEKRQEWQMVTHLLIKQMSEIKKNGIVVDNHTSELIKAYYDKAREIAEKLNSSSELQKKIVRFRMGFSSFMSNKIKAFSNFGLADHEFLRRVYTNEFVSDQVKKEFTIDHLMVVGIVGLYGERADLSHPEHLAADAQGFLWTSRAHWYDMFLNTFSHFFLSGASLSLVFQKLRPQVAKNYAPIEDYRFESRERGQSLFSASKDWMQVFNPIKSDLGGIITKRFLKRFTTMTAGITMMLILRVGIWNMGIENALLAWSFNFVAAQWFFGWIWDPVQRGNEMEGERLEEMTKKLQQARQKINRGDFEEGRAELKSLYEKYNPKVLKLFELEKMSKNELLVLSVDQPPVFTTANKWLSWVTTWTAAVGSTIMAIPLSVILMDPVLLHAPGTWYKWIPISISAYAASYFLQAKYVVKYRDFFKGLTQRWRNSIPKLGSQASVAVPKTESRGTVIRSCEALFRSAGGF